MNLKSTSIGNVNGYVFGFEKGHTYTHPIENCKVLTNLVQGGSVFAFFSGGGTGARGNNYYELKVR